MSVMMNNTTTQQHAAHTFDNLLVSEDIPLGGKLDSGDFILLMDFTPFATSVEGHSRIALKDPCEVDASPMYRQEIAKIFAQHRRSHSVASNCKSNILAIHWS